MKYLRIYRKYFSNTGYLVQLLWQPLKWNKQKGSLQCLWDYIFSKSFLSLSFSLPPQQQYMNSATYMYSSGKKISSYQSRITVEQLHYCCIEHIIPRLQRLYHLHGMTQCSLKYWN